MGIAALIPVLALTFAAVAEAGTVNGPPIGSQGTAVFTANPGEANLLSVSSSPVGPHTIQFSEGTLAITAGSNCNQISPTIVRCYGINATASLGDQDDTYGGDFRSAQVDGGPGDDSLAAPGNLLGGDGDDDLFGTASTSDVLDGGYGADQLDALGGNDVLRGGPGADTYLGGQGDDRLETSYDGDDFQGGAGFDTVDYTNWSSFDPSCFPIQDCPVGVTVTFDGTANDGNFDLDDPDRLTPLDNVHNDVESVIGTAVTDTIDGGSAALDQTFNGAGGDDAIAGGAGADALNGGSGHDTITGGAGADAIAGEGDDDSLTGGPDTDTVVGTGDANWAVTDTQLTGQGTDSLTTIERATLTGGASGNTLDASAFSGQAALSGGPGADTVRGGANNDTLDGGADTDTVLAVADPAHPSLTLTPSAMTGLGSDSLTGFEAATLRGDSGNNTLDASAFAAPVTLDGGPGIDLAQGGSAADLLTGGAGSDTLHGGGAADRVVEAADSSFTLTDASLTGSATGNDSLAAIELATLTGGPGANAIDASGFSGAATLNGAGGADTLSGGSGVATLNGAAGADTLIGGSASDTLNGDEDADVLDGRGAADTLNGGSGDDTLGGGADSVNDALDGAAGTDRVAATTSGNLTLQNGSLVGTGADSLAGIEEGRLTGDAGPNVLNASAFTLGPVTLNGAAGDDQLLGGSQADLLTGGGGVDSFDAGDGDDAVDARDGTPESSIACGAGTGDAARVDTGDTAGADCESVQPPATVSLAESGPSGTVDASSATFTFTGSANAVRFICRLDDGPPTVCTSPVTYSSLSDGPHTFTVHAEDATNDAGPSASRTWTVHTAPPGGPSPGQTGDKTPPETSIDKQPDRKTTKRKAKFVVSSNEPGSTFECALDGEKFKSCDANMKFKVKPGKHRVEFRAIDAAGNVDPTPAAAKWKVKRPR